MYKIFINQVSKVLFCFKYIVILYYLHILRHGCRYSKSRQSKQLISQTLQFHDMIYQAHRESKVVTRLETGNLKNCNLFFYYFTFSSCFCNVSPFSLNFGHLCRKIFFKIFHFAITSSTFAVLESLGSCYRLLRLF